MDDTAKLIQLVISTLNDVEVKGRENLDKLLGSINALESVEKILRAQTITSATAVENREETNGG